MILRSNPMKRAILAVSILVVVSISVIVFVSIFISTGAANGTAGAANSTAGAANSTFVSMVFSTGAANDVALSPIEELGKKIFFDMNLSSDGTVSCASCHSPEAGFTGPISDINAAEAVYPGSVDTRSGNRKPPTAAYGGDSPVLYYDETEGLWIGGMFWDGRATGWTLGDPLAEQAQGPFLNPLEQNLPNARLVCIKVAHSDYADLFLSVWGPGSLDFTKDVAGTYDKIARSISAYEQSAEVNPFSSKYDAYLAGRAELTEQEAWGLELFEGKAGCSGCHTSQPDEFGNPPLFTDFTYDNLGVPKNTENPFYSMPQKWNPSGEEWVDYGLGGFLKNVGYDAAVYEPELGKQKVPTLRNVDLRPYPEFVKAYGHNGYFKSLEGIVHFYNTRDVEPWPLPEYAPTVNTEELGDLGLSAEEEAAVVAFLKTLSDGYIPDPSP
jgi:cytochrome c peroxidase